VTSTWLSIRVDLIEGRGTDLWPRPGRIFAAARSHTFAALAVAIDDAFARWDRAHLHQFWLADGIRVTDPSPEWDTDDVVLDDQRTTLARLKPAEQFVYEFDFGDSWLHLCTVGPRRIDPAEQLGIVPTVPLPYWGWGDLPDQYGRRFDGDDGETRTPHNPNRTDLPPIGPWRWQR
jgi:pRiA4b ORF-3-like protein